MHVSFLLFSWGWAARILMPSKAEFIKMLLSRMIVMNRSILLVDRILETLRAMSEQELSRHRSCNVARHIPDN